MFNELCINYSLLKSKTKLKPSPRKLLPLCQYCKNLTFPTDNPVADKLTFHPILGLGRLLVSPINMFYHGCKIVKVQLSLVDTLRGGNFPEDLLLGGNFPGVDFPGGHHPRWVIFGGNGPGSNYLGTFFRAVNEPGGMSCHHFQRKL